MGPFPNSNGFEYILIAVDYVSRWAEAIPTRTNDHQVVVKFIHKHFFADLVAQELSSVMEGNILTTISCN